ncbi:MAG: NAD(+)/NADH kinase [Acidimicrobiales bacterium]
MASVLLVVHPDRPAALSLAATARRWWESRGHSIVSEEGGEPAGGLDRLDLAVSLGGDGTMLRTVQLALPHRVPVLGVNLGRMGYLAEIEPGGMEAAFEGFARGELKVEERLMLEVTVATEGGGTFVALNEAILEKTAPGHTIRVSVEISGRRFLTYVADGLLMCTPTGSTAYNLSARGPVVSPQLQAVVLTPVAPHLVFDRSLVLAPDEELTLTLVDGRPAAVVLDGSHIIPIGPGDTVTCRGSKEPARFATFGDRDFHALLRSRFGLADR